MLKKFTSLITAFAVALPLSLMPLSLPANAQVTYLHHAAAQSEAEVIDKLPNRDPNAQSQYDGSTALHWALETQHYNGQQIAHQQRNYPALSDSERKAIVAKLLEGGSDPTIKDDDGVTPMHVALQHGIDIFEQVLNAFQSRNGNINVVDENGLTPLYWAIDSPIRNEDSINAEVVRRLISNGADPNAGNPSARARVLELYKESDFSANTREIVVAMIGEWSYTPAEIVGLYNEGQRGANFKAVADQVLGAQAGNDGETPLIKAVRYQAMYPGLRRSYTLENVLSNLAFLEWVGLAEEMVNVKGHNGLTALHHALVFSSTQGMATLIRLGADVNAQDNNGNTPLHGLVSHGSLYGSAGDHRFRKVNSIEKIDMLIAGGADMAIENNAGKSPFEESYYTPAEIVRLYNEGQRGANFKAVADQVLGTQASNDGETPLIKAVRYQAIYPGMRRSYTLENVLSNLAFLEWVGLAEAMVNVKGHNGLTALHHALVFSSTQGMAILIRLGADVNAQDNNGNTPLHGLVSHGSLYGNAGDHRFRKVNSIEKIDMLIAGGADMAIENNADKSPFCLAAAALHEQSNSNESEALLLMKHWHPQNCP